VTVSPTTQSKPDANNNQPSKNRYKVWTGLDMWAEWMQIEYHTNSSGGNDQPSGESIALHPRKHGSSKSKKI